MIVLHSTVGSARSALAWLTNPAARVSAHYLIDKGGKIYRLVPDDLCAWHAGRAEWKGETAVNEASIGIELENANNGRDPYPPEQLDALIELTREKVVQYRIAPEMVVRHVDVALPRGRKSDPAGFPWTEYKRRLFADLPPPPPERPPRPQPTPAGREALALALLNEAYHQAGAIDWPGWTMTRMARTEALGLPIGASFELTVDRRNYLAQSFGRDTLVSPIGDWRRVDRLSALAAPEHRTLRDALLQAVYTQAGEPFRADWAFHQYALRTPLGPPLSGSFRVTAGGQQYVAAIHALDVIYAAVGEWRAIGRLSELQRVARDDFEKELVRALMHAMFQHAGSVYRPTWAPQQYALREQLGAPLGPSFRMTHEGRDYVAEAFALDAVYCEIGEWDSVQRLSDLFAE